MDARRAVAIGFLLLLLAACGAEPAPSSQPRPALPITVRILAGSELTDMRPVLDEAARATGVTVLTDYVGSLDGADAVASGRLDATYDGVWFSSNRYMESIPEARDRLGAPTPVMGSPVVLGVRRSVAAALGWDRTRVTWGQIADAASTGRFSYAMTDPSASNSGFSALVAVATAFAGGRALDPPSVAAVTDPLARFFAGQRLSSGSSGWLSEAFTKRTSNADPADPGPPDGLISYESSLVELNRTGGLPEPLTIVTPSDGVVSADYPLTPLRSAPSTSRQALNRLAGYLRRPEVQARIVATTGRRASVPGVAPSPEVGPPAPVLGVPADRATLDALITTYLDRARRPSRTVYVLDTSGSMAGARLDGLKRALRGLTGADTSLVGQFRRFRAREEVVFLPFATTPEPPQPFVVDQRDLPASLGAIAGRVDALAPRGGAGDSAVYASLESAYGYLAAASATDPDRLTSIVLLTDGENNRPPDLAGFGAFLAAAPPGLRAVPVFPILFGDTTRADMELIASSTGGRTFTATDPGALAGAFREIRGYQ